MSKSTAGSSGGRSKKGKRSPKEDLAKKKKEEEDEDPGFKMAPSNFLTDLLTANTEFDTVWRHKLDDPSEEPYLDMIKVNFYFCRATTSKTDWFIIKSLYRWKSKQKWRRNCGR